MGSGNPKSGETRPGSEPWFCLRVSVHQRQDVESGRLLAEFLSRQFISEWQYPFGEKVFLQTCLLFEIPWLPMRDNLAIWLGMEKAADRPTADLLSLCLDQLDLSADIFWASLVCRVFVSNVDLNRLMLNTVRILRYKSVRPFPWRRARCTPFEAYVWSRPGEILWSISHVSSSIHKISLLAVGPHPFQCARQRDHQGKHQAFRCCGEPHR